MATKGNLKTLPVDHHIVSSSDIVEYLQNQLGFRFDCDFQLWDNRADWEKPMTTNKCYVVMRVIFRPEDIRIVEPIQTYVDKVMEENASGIRFKDDVVEVLKQFMFPSNIALVRQQPDTLQRLAEQGIYGDRLERLIRRPDIFYDQVNKRFGVYLRPELIIKDMCKDADTDKIDGVMAFGYVSDAGNNAAAITWGVNVYHNIRSVSSSGVSIDAVFNSIRA
jgi:hypothetical protein